jgi:hypothetical protein
MTSRDPAIQILQGPDIHKLQRQMNPAGLIVIIGCKQVNEVRTITDPDERFYVIHHLLALGPIPRKDRLDG